MFFLPGSKEKWKSLQLKSEERGFTSDKEDNEAKVDCSKPGCMNVPFCDITADCEAFSVAQFFNIFRKKCCFQQISEGGS